MFGRTLTRAHFRSSYVQPMNLINQHDLYSLVANQIQSLQSLNQRHLLLQQAMSAYIQAKSRKRCAAGVQVSGCGNCLASPTAIPSPNHDCDAGTRLPDSESNAVVRCNSESALPCCAQSGVMDAVDEYVADHLETAVRLVPGCNKYAVQALHRLLPLSFTQMHSRCTRMVQKI